MSSDCSFLRVCVSPAYRLLLEALLVRFLALHLRELRDFLLLEDLPLVFHNLDLFFFQRRPEFFGFFSKAHEHDRGLLRPGVAGEIDIRFGFGEGAHGLQRIVQPAANDLR